MQTRPSPDRRIHLLTTGLMALPALHPLLMPAIGATSHLLWWVHVLPVALVSYRRGRRGAAVAVPLSIGLLLLGERTFGAGYGESASWETAWALAAALLGTHLLVAGFALYARANALRYQLLFDSAASAILRTDDHGRLIAANPAAMRLFGCRWDALNGRRLNDVPWLAHLPSPAALSREGWSGQLDVGCPGEAAVVLVTVAAVGGQDPPGYQIVLVDRTDDVVRDREVERQGRLAALGATLSGVAHELKNPLQVIGAYAELTLSGRSDEEDTRVALEAIRRQSDRMNGLVRELLGFSRGGAERRSVRPDVLIGDVLRMQRVARGRGVRFEERIHWRGELAVNGPKLEQILVNLLSNAVDAVPAGGGVIEVELSEVDGDVAIVVADNGPGVPPELIHRIFDPFVSTKSDQDGTGLGLAICRRLATSMGAELSVTNRPRGGTMFSLRVPRNPAPAPEGPGERVSGRGRGRSRHFAT